MIPGKYQILASAYPFKGYYEHEYATGWFVLFAIHLIGCVIRYPIVDVAIRDCKKMEGLDG